mmetsp:Transcript_33458/g.77733  ORF Transcript_33458/g.77733 Transcript_33458/m.77733 type:complete len:282 (-) Transcript_33458:49-894(-)|eukprot:CAMPEP_0171093324 /NCGR_PEP_ID=MMETSP0766_2-20121228/39014_1 /TAXON_ID=439317 /ORGANISM="Gambierdiscus australes, Strain CAWD 149" /LENGTH=281 /DNA_ID=CAMNT_0011551753 /DNA_START=79 /DNA_END=924 /DNA_ORIENTATION=-
MYRNSYQEGLFSIFHAIGSKPLGHWGLNVRNGHIKRMIDEELGSSAVEVAGVNVSTTYITCPAEAKQTLAIKLPFLTLLIKNLKKYFTFEVEILDDQNVSRRFRASTYTNTPKVHPFITTMPLRMDESWNQLQFNLADFTRRAYGTNYIETRRVTVHASCRLRRIFFADRLFEHDELPLEFRINLRCPQAILPGGGATVRSCMDAERNQTSRAASKEIRAVSKEIRARRKLESPLLSERKCDGLASPGGFQSQASTAASENDPLEDLEESPAKLASLPELA